MRIEIYIIVWKLWAPIIWRSLCSEDTLAALWDAEVKINNFVPDEVEIYWFFSSLELIFAVFPSNFGNQKRCSELPVAFLEGTNVMYGGTHNVFQSPPSVF